MSWLLFSPWQMLLASARLYLTIILSIFPGLFKFVITYLFLLCWVSVALQLSPGGRSSASPSFGLQAVPWVASFCRAQALGD